MPIEELQPERHHILTWDRHSQAVLGHREDHLFQKAVREYRGDILTVRAGEKQTRCTPDHRWLVKWSNKDTKNCCTYLMRRGDRWQTGWCQVFNSEGTLHLGTRATIEKADEAWILSIHADRKDASMEESILAARYGLTTATFRPTHLTEERAGRIWESLDGGEQRERATRCLADHGRMPEHPVWKRGNGTQRVIARLHEMRACNLIPELMSVPSHDRGKKNHWETITEVQSRRIPMPGVQPPGGTPPDLRGRRAGDPQLHLRLAGSRPPGLHGHQHPRGEPPGAEPVLPGAPGRACPRRPMDQPDRGPGAGPVPAPGPRWGRAPGSTTHGRTPSRWWRTCSSTWSGT